MKFYDKLTFKEISEGKKSERKFRVHIGEMENGKPIYANITATTLKGMPTLIDNEFHDYNNCGYTLDEDKLIDEVFDIPADVMDKVYRLIADIA